MPRLVFDIESSALPLDRFDEARARAALTEGQKPWPQDAIDQEMIERTDDGWSHPPAEQDK